MVQVTQYRNTAFNRRVIYTAWDNLKDQQVFFAGINTLEKAGIPPSHVRAYMLIGFDKNETWDRIWCRFRLMVERDIEPYPMVFHQRGQKPRVDLKCFQRWVNLVYTVSSLGINTAAKPKVMKASQPGTAYTLLVNKPITSGNHLIETIKAHEY